MYHIEEGKQWRIGNIFVHIDGDNPHTRIQTALNRLSIRSGEIADIREIKASERRLQASGLFIYDPVRGIMPKISYHIPELDDTQMAGKGGSSFRGQSPDGYWQGARAQRRRAHRAGSIGVRSDGPAAHCSRPGPQQTFVVAPPASFVPTQ